MVIEQKNDLQFPVFEILKKEVPSKVARFIGPRIDWVEAGTPVILRDTPEPLRDTAAYQRILEVTAEAGCIICHQRLNDMRYINKFLEAMNRQLAPEGYLVGCLETSGQRRKRQMEQVISPLNKLYVGIDYVVGRVLPKLPYVKRLYFGLTKGRNRALSEMEAYGRLYSCGFCLVDSTVIDGKLYFIARKVKEPDYNMEATYGPLIRLRRVGKGGKIIKVYKLRTMAPYSEYIQELIYQRYGLGEGCKMKDDPRINEVGKFCRKLWLDELPMVINLLKGDLKLFGVRPISKHYFSLYPEEFQEYRKKFKPGLLPPLYVEIPQTMEDVVDIERRYLEAYERRPLLTDLHYIQRLFYNILIKKVRSN